MIRQTNMNEMKLKKRIEELENMINCIWEELGEDGRNEHYHLFKEYFGEGDEQ